MTDSTTLRRKNCIEKQNQATGSSFTDIVRPISDRLTDSFLGPLTMYFFLWNYELVFYIFEGISSDEKITKIQNHFQGIKPILGGSFYLNEWLYCIAPPIFLTLFFLIVWPIWSTRLLEIIRRVKLERDDQIQNIDESGSKLRRKINHLNEEIKTLDGEINKLENLCSKRNADAVALVKTVIDLLKSQKNLGDKEKEYLEGLVTLSDNLVIRDYSQTFTRMNELARAEKLDKVSEKIESIVERLKKEEEARNKENSEYDYVIDENVESVMDKYLSK